VLADAPVEDLQDAAVEVSGRAADVRAFAADRETLSLKSIGSLATAAVLGDRDENRAAARAAGLDVTPISLQDYVVHLTTREPAATAAER
jgi:ABC-2 type transport system ATP-binding protein